MDTEDSRRSPVRVVMLFSLALALSAAGVVASQPANGAESSAAAKQEVAMIRARIERCSRELSINRSIQKRTDVTRGLKQQLQKRETELTVEITALQAQEKTLRDALGYGSVGSTYGHGWV